MIQQRAVFHQKNHPQVNQDMRDLAKHALRSLEKRGVTGEIILRNTTGFSVTARLGDVETLEHHDEKSFGVTVFHEQCIGSASSSDWSLNAIDASIEKAVTIARFSNPDPCAGLADPSRFAKYLPDCDLSHPWSIAPAEAIQLAIECEKKACAKDKRIINSDGASVSTLNSQVLYANTAGFLGDYASTEHGVSCSLIAKEKEEMQRDNAYTVARSATQLWSIDTVASLAAEKTIQRLGARRIKTQHCPIIFKACIAKSLLSGLVHAISGGNLYRQSSFLLNTLGQKIFPSFVNIFQEPHLLSAMGSCPFDAEGVETVNQHYVRDGELVSYVLGSYSSRKLGMQSTGNAGGVFNLSITHSDLTLAKLIQTMGRGLLVTELMGQGVNITTGDYSRGASGFWIDNGEIQFPVEEITIAGNLKTMFLGIIASANDVDTRGGIRTGSILLDQMTVAGE